MDKAAEDYEAGLSVADLEEVRAYEDFKAGFRYRNNMENAELKAALELIKELTK